jgi:hypothetical protein
MQPACLAIRVALLLAGTSVFSVSPVEAQSAADTATVEIIAVSRSLNMVEDSRATVFDGRSRVIGTRSTLVERRVEHAADLASILKVPVAAPGSRLTCTQQRGCLAPVGVTVISMTQPVFSGDSARVELYATVDPGRQPGGMAKTVFLARTAGRWTVVRERVSVP